MSPQCTYIVLILDWTITTKYNDLLKIKGGIFLNIINR